MTKQLSEYLRKRVVESYNSGKCYAEIADVFGCHRRTVARIVTAYLEEGRTTTRERGGSRTKKLTNEVFIKQCMDENCTTSLRVIKTKLLDNFNVEVSKDTVARVISGF